MSFGRQRNSHGLPIWVSRGSVAPIITGLPVLWMSGATAWTWVLRVGPMNPGMSLSPGELAEREHNPGIGRLVILYDKLDLSAKQTTCLVYLLDSELGTLNPVKAGFGQRSR